MRLTDIGVRALPFAGTQKMYFDDSLSGFAVRVGKRTKTFVILVGPASARERITLGRFPDISLSDARSAAKTILAERTLGKHRRKTLRFDEAKKRYLAECSKKNRPRTVADYTRLLDHFPFGTTHLSDIAKANVRKRLEKLDNRPAEKYHANACIKTFFRWCVDQDYIDNSPAEGLRAPPATRKKDRTLSAKDLAEVYSKARAAPFPFGPIVALLCLLGQRRGEIGNLEWGWIDRVSQTITFPDWATKNGRMHILPYGDLTAALLEEIPTIDNAQYVFPATSAGRYGTATTFNSWSKAKKAFDKSLEGVKPFTLHYLRHTWSTLSAAWGTDQLITEKYLNHVSGGKQSEIAKRYNAYAYLEEKRQAALTFEANLARHLSR